MAEEIPSLENFAVTLEKLKLPKTALIFREELEKKNNMQNIEKTLSSNPLVSILMKKLETPKISSKKNSKKEESKEDPLLSLNLSSKANNSLLETKIFKKLYENFDSQKMTNKTSQVGNIISNSEKSEEKKEKKQSKINTSEILSNSTINNDNKNNSLLNTTNNNEEDSIFTNTNASNMDDSNAIQFNPPPKKLNPRRKNQDKRAEKSYAGNAQLDKMLKISQIKFNQSGSNIDNSSFFMNSRVDPNNTKDGNILNQSEIDEYVDDDDPGFDLFECDRIYQENTSKQLAEQYGYPERAVFKSKYKNLLSYNKNEKHRSRDDTVENSKSNLPDGVKFMKSYDPYYPIINNNVILDSFELKVVMNREKIGYEQEKELKFKKDELIAGRYQYERELGDAAFSTAVQCFDIKEKRLVCIKIIKNNKDYFDQSIDEIKLLRYN